MATGSVEPSVAAADVSMTVIGQATTGARCRWGLWPHYADSALAGIGRLIKIASKVLNALASERATPLDPSTQGAPSSLPRLLMARVVVKMIPPKPRAHRLALILLVGPNRP